MAPTASALTGYYESFNDANDSPPTSQPVAEPVIWYIATTPSSYGRLHNAWNSVCSWTGQGYAACAGSNVQDFNLQSGYTASGIDWSISVDMTIHRKTDSAGTSAATVSVITAGSIERTLAGIGYTGTGGDTFQVIKPTAGTCGTVNTPDAGRTHSDSFTFSYVASSNTVTMTDSVAGTCSFVNSLYGTINAIRFSIGSLSTGTTDDVRDYSEYNNLQWSFAGATGTYTLPVTPDAPAGLSALVADAWDGSSSQTDLRWPVSENDPDQDTGDFIYHVYCNGNELTSVSGDAITTQDGEGFRYHSIVFGGTTPTTCNYFIIAEDRGQLSAPSCSVQVDPLVQNDFESCGDASGIGGPGGVDFTTDTDTAAGLRGFCEGLMGDSDGSLFLCGLILVATVFLSSAGAFAALVAGEKKRPVGNTPMIAGCVGGFGMMVFNVFAGIWGLVWAIVLIVLVAAVLTLVVKRTMGGGGAGGE